jgi:hypothetical protein
LPEGRKAIGSKWGFHIKRKTNEKVEKYCVKVIAQGLPQTKGVDFHEAFATIVSIVWRTKNCQMCF